MDEVFVFLTGLIAFVIVLFKLRGIRKRTNEILEKQEELVEDLKALRGGVALATPAAQELPKPAPVKPATPAPAPAVPPALPRPVAAAKSPPQQELFTPPAPAVPSAASRMAESARVILAKMWNWILWNQETRPTGVSMEYAIATTWLLRLGIVAVACFVIYFLRWSIQQELISDSMRVAIAMLTGVGMILGGLRMLGRKYHLIGQGLLGGGLLSLYFSVYAAGPLYHVIPSITAVFGLMILVTAAAGFLAVRVDSLLVAVLALAGGYLTPVMIRTPTPQLGAFYSYILLLTLAILGVAAKKQWRLLNYLSFIFTYSLFGGSLNVYRPENDFVLAISFLAAYFTLYSSLVYIHNILKAARSTTLEIVHVVLNAGLCAGFGYHLIAERFGRPYPAILSLALAIFFIAHVGVFLWRRLNDRPLLVCLLALAGGFTIWTLPLVMEKETLTICFALLAFMFLWMGRKMGSSFLENLGHGLYIFVFARLVFLDLPHSYGRWGFERGDSSAYWKGMLERLWTFGISIASVTSAFFLQRKDVSRNNRLTVTPGTDLPVAVPRSWATNLFYWFGVVFVFLFLQLEFNRMFQVQWQSMRMPLLTLLWCGMAGFFLWDYLSGRARTAVFVAFCCLTIGAVLKPFVFDVFTWRLDDCLIYREAYTPIFVLARLLDFGAPFLFLLLSWRLLQSRSAQRNLSPFFGYTALALLFSYLSLELNSLLYWKLPEFRQGGISVLWALFGISFIVGGIWRNVRPLRYAGLLLIAVVVGKIFIVDLSGMPTLYRVIAFLVLGVLMLLGSFAYIYSSRKFTRNSTEGMKS